MWRVNSTTVTAFHRRASDLIRLRGGFTHGHIYRPAVRSVFIADNGSTRRSAWVASTPREIIPGPAFPPSRVSAVAGDGEITLSWQPPAPGTQSGYRVCVIVDNVFLLRDIGNCTGPGMRYADIENPAASEFIANRRVGVGNDTTYRLGVRAAYDNDADREDSQWVFADPVTPLEAVADPPDAFVFDAVENAAPNALIIGNTITVAGLADGTSADLVVDGGTVNINGTLAANEGTTGTVANGNTVRVMLMSASCGGRATATVNIGGVRADFVVTSMACDSDAPPAPPINVSAEAGDASFIVDWDAPLLGIAPTEYQVCVYRITDNRQRLCPLDQNEGGGIATTRYSGDDKVTVTDDDVIGVIIENGSEYFIIVQLGKRR